MQQARPLGEAILHPPDPVDVLLILGAGGHDMFGDPPQNPLDRRCG